MNWGIIAQSTFFLATALLAIVITIFVFASSLLGRAVEVQAKEQERLRTAGNKELDEQFETAQKLVTELRKQYGADDLKVDAAVKSLQDAKKQKKEFDKKSNHLKQSYKVFTVQGGVTYPACFFGSSMFLSAIAWGLAAAFDPTSFRVGNWEFYTTPFLYGLVPLSLVLLGLGISRLYLSLQKIQEVAITSEEAALKRTVEAFKIAEKELEAESKPTLYLAFSDCQPPIQITQGELVNIRFHIGLSAGEIARKIEVVFVVPSELKFVTENTEWQELETVVAYPNHLGFSLNVADILLAPTHIYYTIRIKAPPNPGKFIVAYMIICERYSSGFEEFGVEVLPGKSGLKNK